METQLKIFVYESEEVSGGNWTKNTSELTHDPSSNRRAILSRHESSNSLV